MRTCRKLALAALTLLSMTACAGVGEKSASCPTPERSLRPILSTHTPVPYPPISQRLNEQGVTMMAVAIDNDGAPTDVTVKQTSGSNRLDAAAVTYIKTHWRWQPPPQACKAATTAVNVAWHIVTPPAPKSGLKTRGGVETMTIYTPRVLSME
jgi:TonB family protein